MFMEIMDFEMSKYIEEVVSEWLVIGIIHIVAKYFGLVRSFFE